MPFSGSNDGSRAAKKIAEAIDRATALQEKQFNTTQEQVQPFLDAGTGLIPNVVANSSLDGFNAKLSAILNSENFSALEDPLQEAATNNLSAVGLTRSGVAPKVAGDIRADLALQIEQLLSGRESALVNNGQNAAFDLGAARQANADTISNLFVQKGQALSSGILADAQSDAQGFSNFASFATGAPGVISDFKGLF